MRTAFLAAFGLFLVLECTSMAAAFTSPPRRFLPQRAPTLASSLRATGNDASPPLDPAAEKRLMDTMAKRAEDISADICDLVIDPVTGELDEQQLQKCMDSDREVSAAMLEESSY
jgi:hypothetical protein